MPPSQSRPDIQTPADPRVNQQVPASQVSANQLSANQLSANQLSARRLSASQLPDGVKEADLKRFIVALEAAADTLHRLPRKGDEKPAGLRSAWPEMLRASHMAVCGTRRSGIAHPSPTEITNMEEMIALLWSVTARQRQLLWARACRVRWAALQTRYRRSRTTLNRDCRSALLAMVLADRKARTATLRPQRATRGQIQNR
jgi:hypothetical protein